MFMTQESGIGVFHTDFRFDPGPLFGKSAS